MYETTDALFTGICDAIRKKDGTAGLIRHQDIPERIKDLNGESITERYYIYKSGKEMNGHSMTIFQYGSSSEKTDGWIYIHHYYNQGLSSDLIQRNGYKKVGFTFLANAEVFVHNKRKTMFYLRDTPGLDAAGGKDYVIRNGTTYLEENIMLYPDTKTLMSGTVYFDIPKNIEEFYIVFQTVNVDLYIEEIWLE